MKLLFLLVFILSGCASTPPKQIKECEFHGGTKNIVYDSKPRHVSFLTDFSSYYVYCADGTTIRFSKNVKQ